MEKIEKTELGYAASHDSEPEWHYKECGNQMQSDDTFCEDCKGDVLHNSKDFTVYIESRNSVLIQHKSGEYIELFATDGELNQIYTVLSSPGVGDLMELNNIFKELVHIYGFII